MLKNLGIGPGNEANYVGGFSLQISDMDNEQDISDDNITAAYCLTLPGKVLYLSPLLSAKKFRNRGNKDGAVRAFLQLEEEGLGTTYIIGGTKQGGNQVNCSTRNGTIIYYDIM